MGSLAARTVLDKLEGKEGDNLNQILNVEPKLVVRQSTSRIAER